MAVIRSRGGFQALGCATRFCMVLPDNLKTDHPVLWLLGEEGKSADAYLRETNIEELAKKYGVIVVMPEGLHSDYEDMVRGMRWYSYVAEGLPKYLQDNMGLSSDPDQNYVFGFGMGGLGAVKMALRKPGFARLFGCGDAWLDAFSTDRMQQETYRHRMETIYGDEPVREGVLENSDVFHMIQNVVRVPALRLYGKEGSDTKASMNGFLRLVRDRSWEAELITLEEKDFKNRALETFLQETL